MKDDMLAASELSVVELIWKHEPIKSSELVKMCKERFGWQQSTTYTILKRLIVAGMVQNDKSVVTSVISQEQYLANTSKITVNKHFGGSVSKFLAAFLDAGKCSEEEIRELRQIVEEYENRR